MVMHPSPTKFAYVAAVMTKSGTLPFFKNVCDDKEDAKASFPPSTWTSGVILLAIQKYCCMVPLEIFVCGWRTRINFFRTKVLL
ncbi:hypothetical protein JTE90_004901 [Oedothorax gibbosus]|uniref:Uncharacterized protein n=1 Tax=Oedothorax gibbosus TaxID=931172 RepID=A0AAV6TCT4_9ARAC|nr:hypothetical protein JTE90_004901 [Oedothorax gibbosus]